MTFQRVPIPLYKEYVQHHHYMTHVQIYRCRYFIHVGLYIQVDVIHTLLFTVHTYTYTVHTLYIPKCVFSIVVLICVSNFGDANVGLMSNCGHLSN